MQKIKVCSRCKKEFPATTEYFYKRKDGKYNLMALCKSCEYVHQNEKAEKAKLILEKNKHEISLLTKKCNKCGEEFPASMEYFYKKKNGKYGLTAVCKKCKYEDNKQYINDNKEIVIKRQKKWNQNNKEKTLMYKQRWKKKNKDLCNLIAKRRYLKKKQLESTLTKEQWDEIKKDFDCKCAYCGKEKKLTMEHFIPIGNNGEFSINNIIPACQSCNSSKSNKDFFEWYPTYKYYSKERENKILKYLNYEEDGKQQLKLI